MAFETEFAELMHQSVTITAAGAKDAYGHAAAGAARTVKCRIVRQPKMIRDAGGREVVSSGHLFTAGNAAILVTETLTLPDGSSPKILRVDAIPDEDVATHHQKVWF